MMRRSLFVEIVFTLGNSPHTFLAGDFIDNYPLKILLQSATVEMHEVRWNLHGQTVNRALPSGTLFFFVFPRFVAHDYTAIMMNQRAVAKLHCYLQTFVARQRHSVHRLEISTIFNFL